MGKAYFIRSNTGSNGPKYFGQQGLVIKVKSTYLVLDHNGIRDFTRMKEDFDLVAWNTDDFFRASLTEEEIENLNLLSIDEFKSFLKNEGEDEGVIPSREFIQAAELAIANYREIIITEINNYKDGAISDIELIEFLEGAFDVYLHITNITNEWARTKPEALEKAYIKEFNCQT